MSILRRAILAIALIAGLSPAIAQVPPPVPALPDTERRTTYSITASTCACAVGFQLYGDSTDYTNWLTVWVNGAQLPQAGNWIISSPTGQIGTIPRPITDAVLTFNTAQTGTVQIVGARRPRRTSQFSENRGVAARDFNQVLTDIEAQNREVWDRQSRIPQVPAGETLSILPIKASRANMGACFDANGMLTSCVSAPSGSFIAGEGITFTGTNPTTVSSVIPASSLIGYLGGLTMANDLGLPNTLIDTTAGLATSDDNSTLMIIAAFSKNANAAWAVGAPSGCLDSGSSLGASTWYHLFVIKRLDTGVVDQLCSTQALAPVMPTNYTVKRRIGSFKTDASAHILAFVQNGNEFVWKTALQDLNVTLGTTPTLYTLPSVPPGIQVNALMRVLMSNAAAGVGLNIYSPDETSSAGFVLISQAASVNNSGLANVRTNISAQITGRATAATTSFQAWTYGWIDSRGGPTGGPSPGATLTQPPADATSLLQGLLNGGAQIVLPCNGTVWNVTGLTIPAGGGSIRGDCPAATLHLTTNAVGITCTGPNDNPFNVSNLIITGTASAYAGGASDIANLGQGGIHITDCTKATISNVKFFNLSGAGLDCELPSSGFNIGGFTTFSSLVAANTYRGFYTHNSCEYVAFTNIEARNNIFGMVLNSGNVTVAGFNLVYNYNNLQVVGQANPNPCHATLSGGKSNHSNFNLDVLSCSVGLFITGVDFVADPTGSLSTSGTIRIANSKGVNIVGGNMGSNVSVVQCDPNTADCSIAGANMLSNTYVRSDIAGFTNPSVNYAGGLLIKNNFVASGMWGQNN